MTARADDEIVFEMTPRLAEACAAALPAAIRIAAAGLESLVPGFMRQIQAAIDADEAALTVQIDIPTGCVRVLVDGLGWAGPQCLLAVDPVPRGAKIETK